MENCAPNITISTKKSATVAKKSSSVGRRWKKKKTKLKKAKEEDNKSSGSNAAIAEAKTNIKCAYFIFVIYLTQCIGYFIHI